MKELVTILIIVLIIVTTLEEIALAQSEVTISVRVNSKVVVSLEGEVSTNLSYRAENMGGILTVVPSP